MPLHFARPLRADAVVPSILVWVVPAERLPAYPTNRLFAGQIYIWFKHILLLSLIHGEYCILSFSNLLLLLSCHFYYVFHVVIIPYLHCLRIKHALPCWPWWMVRTHIYIYNIYTHVYMYTYIHIAIPKKLQAAKEKNTKSKSLVVNQEWWIKPTFRIATNTRMSHNFHSPGTKRWGRFCGSASQ